MNTQTLAAKILELERKITPGEAAPHKEDAQAWSELVGELVDRLKSPNDTRRSLRIEARASATVAVPAGTLPVESIDLSHMGMGVEGDLNGLRPGDEVELVKVEQDGQKYQPSMRCRVVWRREAKGGRSQAGLEFVSASSGRAELFAWYLRAYRAMLERLAQDQDA